MFCRLREGVKGCWADVVCYGKRKWEKVLVGQQSWRDGGQGGLACVRGARPRIWAEKLGSQLAIPSNQWTVPLS